MRRTSLYTGFSTAIKRVRTTLSTRVDASSDPGRIGGDQVRTVRFEDHHMVLAPPRRLYAGVMQRQELLWERIA